MASTLQSTNQIQTSAMALPQVQSPMSEEDESAETASEGAEPLTPVTDTTPHSFHHQQDATICQVASLPIDETPKFCHIVPPSNATRTPPSYPPPPPPPALTTSFAPPVPSKLSQESDRSDALTSPVDIGSAVDTPKKELPSLYDVPAGWRKTSTDRGRSTVERDSLDSKPAGTNAERKTSPGKPKPGISKAPTAPINSEPKRNIVTRANTFFGRLKRMPSKKFDENPVVSSTPPPPPFDASKPISSTNRAPSKKLEDSPAPPASQPALALPFDASKPISATNRPAKTFEDSPAPTSQLLPAPQFDASKPRSSTNRLPSIPISQSARQTPATSASHTPPSPSSTSSNTAEDGLDDERLRKVTTTGGHMHSKSQNGAPDFGHQGITWKTPAYAPGQTRPNSEHLRRRSASTDQIQKMTRMRKPNEPVPESAHPEAVMLFPTFSKHANEGTGLKARRLSTSLPDQFHVDHCELNKEFKASKLFARRGKTVGKGATAEVTIMARKDSKDAALVAVKEFRGKEKDEDELDYVKKVKSEYTIAKSLHHPNIVETIRLCTHSGRWNHVMEFCDVGDLYHLVEKGLFRSHYKYEDKICMWKQIIRGVDYLHSHGIAHRDVKLENILMTHEGYIKITDFGVSEVFSGEHPGLRVAGGQCGRNMGEVRKCAPGICGSLPYIAPEVLAKSGEYDPRPLDVWSCAIVYVTMHFGGPPWHAAKPDQPNYQKFINGWDKWKKDHPSAEISNEQGGWPKCGELFALIDPPGLRRLLLKMLHPEPEKRVTIRDVLTKSFIKGIDCCSPETVDDGDGACCGKIDASKGKVSASASESKKIKHNHVPPREHKTPKVLQHRFDMGDGWN